MAAPIDRAMVEERLAGIQAAAQAQNLGDLFEYRVDGPITVRTNQSALVPIVRAEVGIERVSVWNERAGGPRPLRGVWLTNSSGLTLDAERAFSISAAMILNWCARTLTPPAPK